MRVHAFGDGDSGLPKINELVASYVAWHNKKKARRLWREAKLVLSIQRGESRAHQLCLAEEIRLARIRQFRAERALIVPTLPNATERMRQFDTKIAESDKITAEEILEEFLAR